MHLIGNERPRAIYSFLCVLPTRTKYAKPHHETTAHPRLATLTTDRSPNSKPDNFHYGPKNIFAWFINFPGR